jgi:hypothetical protein
MINRYLKAKGRWYAAASICLMTAATAITWGMAAERLPRIGFIYVTVCFLMISWLNISLGMRMERSRWCKF